MSEESVQERLERLRARAAERRGSEDGGTPRSRGSSEVTPRLSAAERLARLREKKRSLSIATSVSLPSSPTQALPSSTADLKKKDGRDASDDEGESSDESELDEEGQPILDEKSKIKPLEDDFDGRGIAVKQAELVSREESSHVYVPGASDREIQASRRRRNILKQQMVLQGDRSIEIEEVDGFCQGKDGEQYKVAFNKEEEEQQGLLVQDDGFFIPEVPAGIPRRNVARLEDRLLREMESETLDVYKKRMNHEPLPEHVSARHWFTKGGALIVEDDPAQKTVTQPLDADPILAENDAFKTFSTTLVPPSATLAVSDSGADSAGIDVSIFRAQFDDHPLFIQEDVVASCLRRYFRKYQEKTRENTVDHFTAHLSGLIDHANNLREHGNLGDDLVAIERQVLDIFSRRLAEDLEIRGLAKETYDCWTQLKEVRATQGFTSTNLKLVVMQVEPSFSKEFLAVQFDSVAKIAQKGEIIKISDFSVAEKAKAMLKKYKSTRPTKTSKKRTTGEEGIALRLSDDGALTKDDEVSSKELKRRRTVREEKAYVKVLVNGQHVAATSAANLSFPSFTLAWNRLFQINLVQRPKRLQVEICSNRSFLGLFGKVASIDLPIPASEFSSGVLAHGVGAEDEWHQFSSHKSMQSWLWDKPREKGSKTLREAYTEQVQRRELVETKAATDDRFTAGLIRTRISWSSSSSDRESEVQLSLPMEAQTMETGRFLGAHAGELAGGNQAGGGGGVSAEAHEFDDMIPDFANEVDFQKLIEELKGLDPNDPQNAPVLRLFDVIKWSTKRGVLFRSEAQLREALFATANMERFMQSQRMSLLKIRKEKPHLFHQPIPMLDREIKVNESLTTLLLPEEAQLEMEEESAFLATGRSSEILRVQRQQKARVTDFLNRVRNLHSNGRTSHSRRDVPLSSIIKEGPLPQFNINMGLFGALLEPKRKLRPAPKTRKPVSLNVEKASIFVQVLRAQNVPVRRQVTNGIYPNSPGRSPVGRGINPPESPSRQQQSARALAEDDDEIDQPRAGPERVMSFVQVRFQGTSRRSSAQEGPSPTWNESIFLPFIPPRKDFSPSNLQSITEHVWFNLFDEVIVESHGDDYRTEDATFQRRERRYLGSFSIPFSTIYMNGRVEGMFRVCTPDVNLGYVHKTKGSDEEDVLNGGEELEGGPGHSVKDVASKLRNEASNATYVYLLATLDPVLATAKEENDSLVGSGENPRLVRYAKSWSSRIKRKVHRKSNVNMQLFGTGLNGDAIFAQRFLSSQIPPAGRDGSELASITSLVRFVSLIPFLEDWQAFVEGGNDVWSTSQQFLDIAAGDWEEHAILLCNYLKWLFRERTNIESYIVLGSGIPEGSTVYVLLVEVNEGDRILFNASTGLGYVVEDRHCPLRDVGLVMNEKNIWANVQEFGEPHNLKWNFENTKDWVPFWTERISRIDLPSVQTDSLSYERVDTTFISYLEREISEQVQRSVRRWRAKRGTTRFNKIIGRKLRNLLESLEENRLLGDRLGIAEHLNVLRDTMQTSQVFGFPVNLSFTEMDAILRAVRNTDIHNTTVENTTFALGVLVLPYTNKILSVWIYLASIVQ